MPRSLRSQAGWATHRARGWSNASNAMMWAALKIRGRSGKVCPRPPSTTWLAARGRAQARRGLWSAGLFGNRPMVGTKGPNRCETEPPGVDIHSGALPLNPQDRESEFRTNGSLLVLLKARLAATTRSKFASWSQDVRPEVSDSTRATLTKELHQSWPGRLTRCAAPLGPNRPSSAQHWSNAAQITKTSVQLWPTNSADVGHVCVYFG